MTAGHLRVPVAGAPSAVAVPLWTQRRPPGTRRAKRAAPGRRPAHRAGEI